MTGDQVSAPAPGPSDHRKELQGDNDAEHTKPRRFGRRLVSGSNDLSKSGKDLIDSGLSVTDDRDPWGYETKTSVQVDRGQPNISAQVDTTPAPTDLVATAVIMTAFTVEGISRVAKRKKQR